MRDMRRATPSDMAGSLVVSRIIRLMYINIKRNILHDHLPDAAADAARIPELPQTLAAAVHPEAHNYLYFVAKFDGGEHVFSTNLTDHNKAVRQYLQNRRSAKPAASDAR